MITIKELETDDVVIFDGAISVVRECPHGTLYYAHCGEVNSKYLYRDNDITQEQVDEAVEVSDGDDDHLQCCG